MVNCGSRELQSSYGASDLAATELQRYFELGTTYVVGAEGKFEQVA